MYAFLTWARNAMAPPGTHPNRFVIAGILACGALLYQSKTGGQLVYLHGVGTYTAKGNAQQIGQPPADQPAVGRHIHAAKI